MSRSRLPLSPWIDDFDITGSLPSNSSQQQEQQVLPEFDPCTPDLSIEYGGSGYIAPTSSPTQQATSLEPPSPSQQTPTFLAPDSSTIATMSLPHRPRPQTSSTSTPFPPLSIRLRPSLAPSPSPYGGTPSTTIPPSPIPTSRSSLFNIHHHHHQDHDYTPNLPDFPPLSLNPETLDLQTLRITHFPAPNPRPLTDREEETRRLIDTKIDEDLSHQMSEVHLRLEQERAREERSKANAALSTRYRRRHMRRMEAEKKARRRVRMEARMSAENIKAATKGDEKDEKKGEESCSHRNPLTARQFRERWPLLVDEMRSRRERAVARRRGGGGEGGQGDAQVQGVDEEMQNVERAVARMAMDTAPPLAPQDADQEDSWSMGALSHAEERCSCNDESMEQ